MSDGIHISEVDVINYNANKLSLDNLRKAVTHIQERKATWNGIHHPVASEQRHLYDIMLGKISEAIRVKEEAIRNKK